MRQIYAAAPVRQRRRRDADPHAAQPTAHLHFAISRAGFDLKTIQKNVGHASPRMIMKIYGETFDESQVESVGRFMSILDQAAEDAA